MSDEPQVAPREEENEVDHTTKPTDEPTRDILHRKAKEQIETHSEKRKRCMEEILGSFPNDQETDDKSPEIKLQKQTEDAYNELKGWMQNFWAGNFTRESRMPTRTTDDGTKIYVLDHGSSISSLVAYNPDKHEIYQLIQLPPVDGKVKIVGLLYTPQGFEITETEADADLFENEHAMWEIIGSDSDEKNKLRPEAPILNYFDDLSAKLDSPDLSFPFFVSPENIKVLNRAYFLTLSEHPDYLTGPLPEFNLIVPTRIYQKPKLPTDNDPESVKIREIHFALEGLTEEMDETFNLAAEERPDSRINYIGTGKIFREITGRDTNGYRYIVRRNVEGDEYSIYKKRPDNSDIEDFLTIYVAPGRALRGALGGGRGYGGYSSGPVSVESKEKLREYFRFLKDLQKTLTKEAKSNKTNI